MDTLIQESSFTKPATPAAHAAALSAAESRIELIPITAVTPSPTNPRNSFDGIEELAASIAAQGLLQPIVVRPLKADGKFEIVAGERRFRALKHLKRTHAPCRVMVADDGKARAMQIIENLQREDIGPVEEAEAFKALHDLDPEAWSPQAIGKAVGKTDRFVQQRIAIAGGLLPPLKERLAKGDLSIEVARTLAPLPESLQKSLQDHWAVQRNEIDRVRQAITDTAIPLSRAKFDPKLYSGDKVEAGKKTFALDTAQFKQLQAVEARKVVEKLKADWPDARLVDSTKGWHFADDQWGNDQPGGYGDKAAPRHYTVPKDRCTAIVWVHDDGSIRQAVGVCNHATWKKAAEERAAKTKASSRAPSSDRYRGETPAEKKAREAFNEQLHKALVAKPAMALRALLVRALNEWAVPSLPATLPASLAKAHAKRDDLAAWQAAVQLTPEAIDKALAQLGAAEEWEVYDGREPPPLLRAIGKAVGVEPTTIEAKPTKAAPKAKPATKAKPKTAAKRKAASSRKKKS